MRPFRVVVVDDEPLAREGVAALVAKDPDCAVVASCSNGDAALKAIDVHGADLLFLDVQMPGLSGFDVLRRLSPDRRPAVVFVTAYDAYALRAFEAHAVDYLLKPFSNARFRTALERAKGRSRARAVEQMSGDLQRLLDATRGVASTAVAATERFVVRHEGRTVLVPVDDVDWIEAADYYSALHVGTQRLLLRESLSSLADRLDPRRFFRSHRSAIVNLDRVRTIQPWFRGELVVVLTTGVKVRLTRARRSSLEQRLGASS